MDNQAFTCRICGSRGCHRSFVAREMMLGLKDEFGYFQCHVCGCLQIAAIPPDMTRYYPHSYYSLPPPAKKFKRPSLRKRWRRYLMRRAYFGGGRVANFLRCHWLVGDKHMSLAAAAPKKGDVILDVGCGSGAFLRELQALGFENLVGVDQFIDSPAFNGQGLRIIKGSLESLSGRFDIIMFHHSFEHLPDQHAAMRGVAKLLSDNGVCIVRIPLSSSFAFDNYGVNWVQWDAPRHFYLHSLNSFRTLAEQEGFELHHIYYDSSDFQFWGSEQYARGIALTAPESYGVKKRSTQFTRKQIEDFKLNAGKLNAERRGDQGVFYLRRPAPRFPAAPAGVS